MITRICLITPPSIFLLDERVFMTLGILKVAAVLEKAGIEVEMLDLSGVENYEEVVQDHAAGSSTTCYGITATTPQMPAATKVYRTLRAVKPGARIILGGPHVTLIHAAYKFEQKRGTTGRAMSAYRLLEEMFDVLVVGDGEAPFEPWVNVVLCVPSGARYRAELELFSPTRETRERWRILYETP